MFIEFESNSRHGGIMQNSLLNTKGIEIFIHHIKMYG